MDMSNTAVANHAQAPQLKSGVYGGLCTSHRMAGKCKYLKRSSTGYTCMANLGQRDHCLEWCRKFLQVRDLFI
jgi:hypothetical protein